MSDENASGSRWEPTPAAATDPTAAAETAGSPSPVSASPRRGLRDRLRSLPRRPLLAGAAALLVLLVGLGGGFALGRATAPDGSTSPVGVGPDGRDGGPGGFGDHGSFGGDRDGDGDVGRGGAAPVAPGQTS